jgi:glutathione S-transferase
MKIYDAPMAPNPRKVRMFLVEKGINMEYVPVDITKAESRGEEFRAKINRMGRVPVLELDDGTHISESLAICRYFEALQADPPLMGRDAKEQGLIAMWDRRMDNNVISKVAGCFQHTHPFFSDRMTQFTDYGEQSRKEALEAFAMLDEVLSDRQFIAGDIFSLADITAFCGVAFARVIKLKPADDQKNLVRWFAEVSARPSAA